MNTWPEQDLEVVDQCPVCTSPQSQLLIEGAEDNIFHSAPGRWNYYQCQACESLYLNPRPTEASIERAYKTYYTHRTNTPTAPTGIKALVRALANGYRNWRFGTELQPANPLGEQIKRLPYIKKQLDQEYRFLPKPEAGQRLLDIGSGNGDFLAFAQSIGWQVAGIETDATAVDVAQSRGLEVHQGTIFDFPESLGQFDHATIVQVIEHLHDPLATLMAIRARLKPGAILLLDTPNAQSPLLKQYGADWRGLEPPRHLFVPSWQAISQLLVKAGFEKIQYQPKLSAHAAMAAKSRAVAGRRDPYKESASLGERLKGNIQDLKIAFDKTQCEYITVTARKSKTY